MTPLHQVKVLVGLDQTLQKISLEIFAHRFALFFAI
jgi:hypothetical protein